MQPVESLDELGRLFDLTHISRNPARFDTAELSALSARTLHVMPFARAAPRLAELGIDGDRAEPFWLAVRGNCDRLDDALAWWAVVSGEIDAVHEDAALLTQAAALLPSEPWSGDTWGAWTTALKASSGRKGRALFHPLRLALTGRESGPELAALLPLMGRRLVEAKLAVDRPQG